MSNQNPSMILWGQMNTSLAGQLRVAVTDMGLFAVDFDRPYTAFIQSLLRRAPQATISQGRQATADACQQIQEYLQGERLIFNLAVDLTGLPGFQQQVLLATLTIPYGQTASYAEIAQAIGHPGAARAVGRAEATNPIPLVIPCHRVVGSDGKLHGYGGPGGISLKAKLLELERTHSPEASNSQPN